MEVNKTAIAGFFLSIVALLTFLISLPTGYALGSFVLFIFVLVSAFSIISEGKEVFHRLTRGVANLSQATEGRIEIKGQVSNIADSVVTWIAKEKAWIKRIHFSYTITKNYSAKDGETRTISETIDLYRTGFEHDKLLVNDGTGECWVLLQNSDYNIHQISKVYKAGELAQLLEDTPIQDFPTEELEKIKRVSVTEEWIPVDQPVHIYGYLQKVKLGDRPKHHQQGIDLLKNTGLGSLAGFTEDNWLSIDHHTSEKGLSEYFLMADKDLNKGVASNHRLTVSTLGRKKLNLKSFGRLLLMMAILIAGSLGIYYIFLYQTGSAY